MPPRGYVLIFFGWALLAIVTPTLIFWSASAKQNGDDPLGEASNEPRISRRMMVSFLENGRNRGSPVQSIVQALSPAPAPAPMAVNRTSIY